MRPTLLVALAILVAGCSQPPEADRATPPTATAPDGDASPAGPRDPTPTALPAAGNEDLRARIADHHANATVSRVVLVLTNLRDDPLRLNYATIESANDSLYLAADALVPGGEERTITMEDASGFTGDRLAPWTAVALYYTRGLGSPDESDGAASIDLRGQGLPDR